jgi:hypothetical protein
MPYNSNAGASVRPGSSQFDPVRPKNKPQKHHPMNRIGKIARSKCLFWQNLCSSVICGAVSGGSKIKVNQARSRLIKPF